MKRETLSTSAGELEVSSWSCQPSASCASQPAGLCCGCSAGSEHPEHQCSSAGLELCPSTPERSQWQLTSHWGRLQGVKRTSLSYNCSITLFTNDVTKSFCGQWGKNKPEQQFHKVHNPTESTWIYTSPHPPFSICMCSLFTGWEVQTGLRNGICNFTTIFSPVHKNIILRQTPCLSCLLLWNELCTRMVIDKSHT